MTIESRLILSYYKKVADIKPEHEIYLIQHVETGKFYVQKTLTVYNLSVFRYLAEHPVPGIPRIFELVEADSKLILIEEYVSGDTLQEILDRCGRLPEEKVIDYTIQLCTVLKALHGCTPPIIHRDIKPSNIIITPDDAVRLIDLNAARCHEGDAAADTTLIGTPGFAAPEQYGFGASNEQTDLYAVGILMNVLLTGELSHTCTASGRLASVIRKCLPLNPRERWKNVSALKAALWALKAPKDRRKSTSPDFRPPGFRTGNPLHMILAAAGYVFICYVTLFMASPKTTAAGRFVDHVSSFAALMSIVFFSANYLNIHSGIPFMRRAGTGVRILIIVMADIAIFFVYATFMASIRNVLP